MDTNEQIENAVDAELKPWLMAIETSVNETREELPMKFKQGLESLNQLSFGAVANVTSHIDSRIAVFEAKMADSQLLIQHQVSKIIKRIFNNLHSQKREESLTDLQESMYNVPKSLMIPKYLLVLLLWIVPALFQMSCRSIYTISRTIHSIQRK